MDAIRLLQHALDDDDEDQDVLLFDESLERLAASRPCETEVLAILSFLSRRNQSWALSAALLEFGNQGLITVRCLPELLHLLEQPEVDQDSAITLAEAIGRLGQEGIRLLLGLSEHPDEKSRVAAIGGLARSEDTSEPAMTAIIRGLVEQFQPVMSLAKIGLANRGSVSIPYLRDALPHLTPKSKAIAAEALLGIDPASSLAISTVAELLTSENPETLSNALFVAGYSEPACAQLLPHCVRLCFHPNLCVFRSAVGCLIKLGPRGRDAFDAVLERSRSEDFETRASALLGLTCIEDVRAIPALVESLEDDGEYIALASARALRGLAATQPEAQACLLAMTEDSQVSSGLKKKIRSILRSSLRGPKKSRHGG